MKRHITIRLEPDKHRRLKLALAKQERSIQSLFDEWLDRFLKRNEK